jgi:hypothetical protein
MTRKLEIGLLFVLEIILMTYAATSDRSVGRNSFESAMTAEKADEILGKSDNTFLSSERRKHKVGTLGSVSDLPFIDYANTVEFHILLSSLPFNTNPILAKLFSQISDGTELPSFHVGLGVWDTFTDTKISLEFIPNDLLATLLPTLSEKKITWKNTGSVVTTNPMSTTTSTFGYPGNWRESRLVSTSSGE